MKAALVTGALVLVLVVLPIVALLLEHQRKMARLIRGESPEESGSSEIAALFGAGGGGSDGSAVRALMERVSQLEAEVASLRRSLPQPEGAESTRAEL